MVHKPKYDEEVREFEARKEDFKSIMEPAMHLLRESIVEDLAEMGFFTAPASTKYHGAYMGGLFDHSVNVTSTLLDLTRDNSIEWQRPESPLIVGMFHDICKADQYRHPVKSSLQVGPETIEHYDTTRWEHDDKTLLKGHGDKSVMLLSNLLTLTPEEVLCIRYHMGAFTDKSEWSDYTRAIHAFPSVLWTHHADMIAAHILEVD